MKINTTHDSEDETWEIYRDGIPIEYEGKNIGEELSVEILLPYFYVLPNNKTQIAFDLNIYTSKNKDSRNCYVSRTFKQETIVEQKKNTECKDHVSTRVNDFKEFRLGSETPNPVYLYIRDSTEANASLADQRFFLFFPQKKQSTSPNASNLYSTAIQQIVKDVHEIILSTNYLVLLIKNTQKKEFNTI